nr:death domain-associated protein 6-like [Ipomoea batatas]
MGKKRVVKKTMELSVAIAESSSMTGDNLHQQQQTPRKRGRPRKIVPKEEEFEEQTGKEDVAESESKKPRISGEEESSEHKVETKGKVEASSSPSKKEDDEEASRNISQKQQARSRGRRKSKPRKSS